jgi:hypothetical protein
MCQGPRCGCLHLQILRPWPGCRNRLRMAGRSSRGCRGASTRRPRWAPSESSWPRRRLRPCRLCSARRVSCSPASTKAHINNGHNPTLLCRLSMSVQVRVVAQYHHPSATRRRIPHPRGGRHDAAAERWRRHSVKPCDAWLAGLLHTASGAVMSAAPPHS